MTTSATTSLSAVHDSMPDNDPFRKLLLAKLVEINTFQRDKKDSAELRIIAECFASKLSGETLRAVLEAIDLHCKRSSYFPTLHDIIELLPETRKAPKQAALPEKPQSKTTPGIHILLAHLMQKRATENERMTAIYRFQAAYAEYVRAGKQWPFSKCNDNAASSLIARIIATKKSGNDLAQ